VSVNRHFLLKAPTTNIITLYSLIFNFIPLMTVCTGCSLSTLNKDDDDDDDDDDDVTFDSIHCSNSDA